MAFWFLDDLARLNAERSAITELHADANWLVGLHWYFENGLQLDATIRVGERDFDITLAYPKHFPFAPPVARPTSSEDELWSTHQYGDGTLCLEWGPDNWSSDLTGADMLRSAHRLLTTERPDSDNRTLVAPSRHKLTEGQELRGEIARFCTTASLRSHCSSMQLGTCGEASFSLEIHKNCASIVVTKICPKDGSPWFDPEVPAGMETPGLRGIFCKLDLPGSTVDALTSSSELLDFFEEHGSGVNETSSDGESTSPSFAFVVDCQNQIHAFWLSTDEGRLLPQREVAFDSTLDNPRQQSSDADQKNIRVGIVGLGSIGSKVAVTLARHGFREYVLVDPDVLVAENLVRHQLDWGSVGDHKADAVASAIERLVPGAVIDISKLHLTGQENNTELDSVLCTLTDCSILIDATADDSVFNLLAAAATQEKIPLVWGHVFEGGFGGLIARSRPDKDPSPHQMRQLFLNFCCQHPFPQHEGSTPYAGIVEETPLVAGDTDVSVIAAHLAGMAVDVARNAEPPRYPNSMYLIGMERGWIFDSPFHTIPLSTNQQEASLPSMEISNEVLDQGIKFIRELLNDAQNQDSTT